MLEQYSEAIEGIDAIRRWLPYLSEKGESDAIKVPLKELEGLLWKSLEGYVSRRVSGEGETQLRDIAGL